jgi:hypothetical protein
VFHDLNRSGIAGGSAPMAIAQPAQQGIFNRQSKLKAGQEFGARSLFTDFRLARTTAIQTELLPSKNGML